MKHTKILLFFLLLLSGFAHAQSADTMEEEKRLTKAEMAEAKKLNLAMSKSKDFIRQNEIYKIIIPMLKVKSEDIRGFFNDRKDLDAAKIQSWAEKNAQPEKSSEVVKLMEEQAEVLKKLDQDNKRLFELYRKAGFDEVQEIAMSIY
jgi:hypothetical protein